jgi:hypothetical protein
MLALIGRAYTIFYSIGQGVVAAYTAQHNTATAAGRAEYNDHYTYVYLMIRPHKDCRQGVSFSPIYNV